MKKLFRSLQVRYMLLILIAISLIFSIQIVYVVFGSVFLDIRNDHRADENYTDYALIEQNWHAEANAVNNFDHAEIQKLFNKWNEAYPKATMFWVDKDGYLQMQVNVQESHPKVWTATYTVQYVKEHYGEDPFTVISFVGQEEQNGFVVLEIPRESLMPPLQQVYEQYGTFLALIMLVGIIAFICISYIFFRKIRKRLLQLQEAMDIRDINNLPNETQVKYDDEVGELERAFNRMVNELRESKYREQQEEQLRRELIASLSHDLRTPLTKIRAQVYSLSKEELSENSKQSLEALELSIQKIDRLIENLMSYTLLMASKYKLENQQINIIRFLKELLATWYPAFEKEHFEIDVDIAPFDNNLWEVDPIWLSRIIDNLLQNVLRHAKDGQYLQVKTLSTETHDTIIFRDCGKGMAHTSIEKGAGIGLSIVDMMVKGLGLRWDIQSDDHGTTIKIIKPK